MLGKTKVNVRSIFVLICAILLVAGIGSMFTNVPVASAQTQQRCIPMDQVVSSKATEPVLATLRNMKICVTHDQLSQYIGGVPGLLEAWQVDMQEWTGVESPSDPKQFLDEIWGSFYPDEPRTQQVQQQQLTVPIQPGSGNVYAIDQIIAMDNATYEVFAQGWRNWAVKNGFILPAKDRLGFIVEILKAQTNDPTIAWQIPCLDLDGLWPKNSAYSIGTCLSYEEWMDMPDATVAQMRADLIARGNDPNIAQGKVLLQTIWDWAIVRGFK